MLQIAKPSIQQNVTYLSPCEAFLAAIQARKQAVFADPDFHKGFESGLEMIEEIVDQSGEPLTDTQVLEAFISELDPETRERSWRVYGVQSSSAYVTGFMAAFTFTYLAGPLHASRHP